MLGRLPPAHLLMARLHLKSVDYRNARGESVSLLYPNCGSQTELLSTVSLARIIVYSMMPDGTPAPASGASTPAMTPFSSGMATPHGASTNGKVADYLSAGLGSKFGRVKEKKYIGGSKALDALSKLIISVESFFHPTNSGKWTNDLTAFVKYLAYEFNKRWHEEQKPDCKTPKVCLEHPRYTVPP